MLSTDYNNELKTFMETKEYKEANDDIKSMKLANKKLGLLMKEVFTNKVSTTPLKA